eukprot:TRINITY_DN71041_c0_g1_i1.p2 TRINITY_DN71041_c0_g1~~TRINITY_DN71041_c0_g1_i1.p2  ORF type:complete len:496 (+),score=42.44 TRINITY_DN71041_c0_g1_i1:2831-4318(+)
MNNDEAIKCIEIAEAAIARGDYEKAKRFLQKSLKMCPTEKAKKLLSECDRSQSRPKGGGPTPSRRKISKEEETKESSTNKGYSNEDARLAADIVSKTDYYSILGVAKTATEDEIKKQYKKLALKLHPDKNRAPQAADAFKKLSQACTCLTDKNKRKIYDEQGSEENFRQQYRQRFYEEEIDPEDIFDLLFNGRINPNRRRRRFYHNGNVYHYTENVNRRPRYYNNEAFDRNGAANNGGRGITALLQLMPILLVLLLALLIQFKGLDGWSNNKEYSFAPSAAHKHYRVTQRTGIRYYVNGDFDRKYMRNMESLRKIEERVENDYLDSLWKQCSYAKYVKSNLEERRFYARSKDRGRISQELTKLDMSSCENYIKLKKLRSQQNQLYQQLYCDIYILNQKRLQKLYKVIRKPAKMGTTPTKQIDPKEEARQNKRLIGRAQRKIERERKKLGLSEKKYLTEIKALAKQGKHVKIITGTLLIVCSKDLDARPSKTKKAS